MNRFARRSFGAFAFVLMLLRVIAPELGHQCAMDVAPVSVATAASTADPHSAHAAHVPHHNESTAASTPSPTTHHGSDEAPAGGCECADWCCCLPGVADTPRSTFVLAAVVSRQTQQAATHANAAPRAPTARLLPFATAPPAA